MGFYKEDFFLTFDDLYRIRKLRVEFTKENFCKKALKKNGLSINNNNKIIVYKFFDEWKKERGYE